MSNQLRLDYQACRGSALTRNKCVKAVFILLIVLFSLPLDVTAQKKRKPVTVPQTSQTKQPSSDTEKVPVTQNKSVESQPQLKTDERFNLINQISDFADVSFSKNKVVLSLTIPSASKRNLNTKSLEYWLTIRSSYEYNLFSGVPQMTLDLDTFGNIEEREKFRLTNEMNVFADSEKMVFVRPSGESLLKAFKINSRHLEGFAASNSLTIEIADIKIELDKDNIKAISLFNQLLKS